MPYEIIHDAIARLVYDKASVEARTRRKVEREIRERREAYEKRGAHLSKEDLDYFQPWLTQVNLSAADQAFLNREAAALRARRRRRNLLIVAIIAVLLAFSLVSFGLFQQSEANLNRAEAAIAADQAKALKLEAARDSALEAFGYARYQSEQARRQADTAQAERLRAEEQAAFALYQQKEAEKATQYANMMTLRSHQAELAARKSDSASQAAALRARLAAADAQQKAIEAQSAAFAAQARRFEAVDPTLSLQLAYTAFQVRPSGAATQAFRDRLNDAEAPLSTRSLNHTQKPLDVAVDPLGEWVFTTALDGQLRRWAPTKGTLIDTLNFDKKLFILVDVSPDGQHILAATDRGGAVLWNRAGEVLHTFSWPKDKIHSLDCGNRKLAFGSVSGEVSVYDMGKWNKAAYTYFHPPDEAAAPPPSSPEEAAALLNPIALLALSPDEQQLLLGGGNNPEALLLDLSSGSKKRLKFPKKWFNIANAAGDRPYISVLDGGFAAETGEFTVNFPLHGVVRYSATGQAESWIPAHEDDLIARSAIIPDGDWVLTVNEAGTSELWNREQEVFYRIPVQGEVLAVAFANGWRELWLATSVGKVLRFDTWRRPRPTFANDRFRARRLPVKTYRTLAQDSAQGRVLVGNQLFDAVRMQELKTLSFGRSRGGNYGDAAFTPTGDSLLLAQEGYALLWDVARDQPLDTVLKNDGPLRGLAIAPDGRSFFAGSGSAIGHWNWDGENLHTYKQLIGAVTTLALSPTGDTLLIGNENGVAWLTSVNDNQLLGTPVRVHPEEQRDPEVNRVSFSPDGKAVLLDGKLIRDLVAFSPGSPGYDVFFSLGLPAVFSPDNRYLLSVQPAEPSGYFWNPLSGQWPAFLSSPAPWEREVLSMPSELRF